jgi:hypothetical protein
MFRFDAETITEGHGFRRRPTHETPKSSDLAAAKDARQSHNASRRMPMSNAAHSFDNPAGRQLLAAIGKIRRMTSGDPKYHSGRKKKEYASPYLEFLDKLGKTARRMPQPYEFDLGHTDGIRHADLDAGVRVLSEVIYECQRSLEEIEHARLDLDARGWARARGLRE